ncbi:MAG: histidine kinase [Spirochaetales bacterium]|nr:histidine kinase [Spirochaetales bacterium]
MYRSPDPESDPKTIFTSLLVILVILVITGFILALIINFMYGKFSGRLIKISLINSIALAGGVFLNLFITRMLVSRIKPQYIFFISFGLIAAVSISGFLYIFILEPFFFLYGSNLINSYFLINFVFTLSLTIISSGFLIYQRRILEKEKIIHTERLLRKEMEQKLYNAKINPHFLFNSLNLIISLLPAPEKAEEALTKLSEIFRYHLDTSSGDTVPLSSELENIRKYLFLQKLRFEERLSYQIIEKTDGFIPPLIIQPLVENSVKHNIKKVKHLEIEIVIMKSQDIIIIQIHDSCRNVTTDMIGKGSGLTITKKRLEMAGGQFKIYNGGIIMEIPVRQTGKEKIIDKGNSGG